MGGTGVYFYHGLLLTDFGKNFQRLSHAREVLNDLRTFTCSIIRMDLLLPAHSQLMRDLLLCITRWEAMQASTGTYVENASIDLTEAHAFDSTHLGVLDPDLVGEIRSASFASGDRMLRGLRMAVDAFDRVVESLQNIQGRVEKLRDPKQFHLTVLIDWIDDATRMFRAEAMHKRLVLATVEGITDSLAVERTLLPWLEEPYLNRALIQKIKEALEASGGDDV